MLTSRFDRLVLHHPSACTGPVYLTAPDAAVYVERPPVPSPASLGPGLSSTFPDDVLTATVTTTFERLVALAKSPGEPEDILRLIGPDRDRCREEDVVRYRTAVDAGQPSPMDVVTAQVLVRRGAVRAFVAERWALELVSRLEQWNDASPEGLAHLEHLLHDVPLQRG